jgi:hypothetical protein
MTALTAPFDGAWTSRLGGALECTSRVQVTGPTAPLTLDVTEGTVTYDEDSAPAVTATMRARIPTDPAVLDAIDPRLRRRLLVTTGYRVPGGAEEHPLCELLLTARTINRPDAAMVLTAVSDERDVMDTRPLTAAAATFGPSDDASAAITRLIKWAVPTATVHAPRLLGTFIAPGDSLVIDREDDIWPAIQDIADRTGAWVHHDGLSRYVVEPQPLTAGPAVADLKVGPGGTITRSQADLNRDEFANTVTVLYRWYDGEQRTAYGWAEISSGPYAVAQVGRKVKPVTIERKGSNDQARASAQHIVQRAVTRGRSLSIELEHAPYWVRPGHTVTVQLPTGAQQRHIVRRIDFDIPSGRAHIRTRQPEDVTVTTGE